LLVGGGLKVMARCGRWSKRPQRAITQRAITSVLFFFSLTRTRSRRERERERETDGGVRLDGCLSARQGCRGRRNKQVVDFACALDKSAASFAA